jgi:hypothetical protein
MDSLQQPSQLDTPQSTAPTQGFARVTAGFKAFKEKHHLAFEVMFFFAGFTFDVVLLHRIDSVPLLFHQAFYLVSSAALIFVDHRIYVAKKEPEGFWGKLASYRLWVMHFFLGTLLNAFMVFYFKASSGLFAFFFLLALGSVMVLNELPFFRRQGPVVRVALLSFATTSFLAYLIPVVVGDLAPWQYYVSVLIGSAVTVGLWKLFRAVTKDPDWSFSRAVAPGLAIQVLLLVLYVGSVIPPVPLAVKHMGIYSNVERERRPDGLHFATSFQPAPFWMFWRSESSTLVAHAGDKAWVFVRIFAPSRFNDQIAFAWDYYDVKNGWTQRGSPFRTSLSGGGEEGFRTVAYSTLSKPGDYRVRVLSDDGRELGRRSFTFVEGEPESTMTVDN